VIVEESAAVQELVEQALRESGNRVLVTQNALEVLDVASRLRIDLLVIDLDSQPALVEEVPTGLARPLPVRQRGSEPEASVGAGTEQ
jgi:CheY-like chemotaxis protein